MIFIIYLLNLLYADILGKFRISDTSKIDRVQMKVKKLISGSKLGRYQLVFWNFGGARDLTNLWVLESTVNLGEFENVKMIQLIIVAYCSNSDHNSIKNFQRYFIQLVPQLIRVPPTSFWCHLRVRCRTYLKYYWE